ncbi:hypothetical protein AMS68_003385 [Peltaster fructicola]|uniref:Uncharacterized protein n=1 Tax=Peltaster fructicola TaxID=286661 RepID=A0A6H0XTC5_9PEZI|nr:hypothetical protein AMS68_003385 [Peltaster fructicola]
MYSHSLKWKSDGLKVREQYTALNKARASFCPKSCAWTRDLNITKHRQEMKELYEQQRKVSPSAQSDSTLDISEASTQDSTGRRLRLLTAATPSPVTLHTPVLAVPSVFVWPYGAEVEEFADWPCKEERDYEGDSRVKTEKIHARMLPAPRLKGNDTVAWSLRKFVDPFPLDDFRGDHTEVGVFMRNHYIAELELTDQEGVKVLGEELMSLLNPVDTL